MIEFAIIAGLALGLSALASEWSAVAKEHESDKAKYRADRRSALLRERLEQARARMAQIESQVGSSGLTPALEDEYDRLQLEEKILLSEDLP